MSKGIRRNSAIRKTIPAFVARKVGQIITSYAYLDYSLRTLVRRLSGVSETVGRLAVRDPRASEKLQLVRDLLFLRGTVIDDRKFKVLHAGISEVERLRDLIAHGIWTEHDGEWSVIAFKGRVDDQTIHPTERKREIRPETFSVTHQGLANTLQSVQNLIASVESLEKIATSQEKSQSPPHQEGHRSKVRAPEER